MSSEHFEVVIVGSGFGGSVMAYRLAEAGVRVLLLERGKPFPPNSFPRDPLGLKENFWDPDAGLHGMFNLWSFRHIDSLVSSGLGGGSLIYANVLLRKDPTWFNEPGPDGRPVPWPISYEELEPHYEQVERMMNVQKYPLHEAPYNQTLKTLAMKEAADALKAKGEDVNWELINLAVTFHNDGEAPIPGEPIKEEFRNLHDRTRYTCRLCGECDAGCNYGSKNSLDFTYLSAAKRLGAEIRTLCDVRSFFPNGKGGYTVRYDELTLNEARGPDTPKRVIDCDRLVISAGTLGSTELMLKNRAFFPNVSPKLGSHFSGNGDFLSFALSAHERNAEGKKVPRTLNPSFGPVITSAIRHGDAADGAPHTGRGFYLEDAGYPAFLSWIVETSNRFGYLKRGLGFAADRIGSLLGINDDTNLSDEVSDFLGPCTLSSASMPMLGMGRDTPDGTLELEEDNLQSSWKLKESSEYFERLRHIMKGVADHLQADYLDNPIWYLGKRVITVHPLGGCPMGATAAEGVVDTYGEVHNYPGLYVVDGSVLPGPTGANPSLTIAAVSNRAAERMLEVNFAAKVAVPKVVSEEGVVSEAPTVEAGAGDVEASIPVV